MEEYKLNDIANDLLILNKITIEKLFELENCVDCVALYMFLYKTTKWQKTNIIKANDTYIAKCLKWGKNKVTSTKKILKENGLINIVQRRTSGRIDGWYIEVTYLVNKKSEDEVKTKVIDDQFLSKQEVVKTRTCSQDTNAYKEQYKCLNNKYKMLIEENNKLKSLLKEKEQKPTKPKQQKQFIPPTLEEVENYCKERNNKVNPKKFYDYYDVNDWKDKNGKSITNWKQKMIANWEGKEEVYSTTQTTYKPKYCNDGYKGKKIDFADYTEEQIKEFIHNKVIDENGVVI